MGRGIMCCTCPSVRSSVRSICSSIISLVNTILWKRLNRFWLMQTGRRMFSWSKGIIWHDQLWESGGQKSTSQKVECRVGGLAEALFSTPVGRVALLTLFLHVRLRPGIRQKSRKLVESVSQTSTNLSKTWSQTCSKSRFAARFAAG